MVLRVKYFLNENYSNQNDVRIMRGGGGGVKAKGAAKLVTKTNV